MKNKNKLVILGIASMFTMLTGFSQAKTELMADNYVRGGVMNLEIDKSQFVKIVDDQLYFIADGSNENITQFCSMEDYYMKQLVVDDYMHTIVIGGDISGNISGYGGISELGFVSQINFLGELDNDNAIRSDSMRCWSANFDENPRWFENLCNDYNNTIQ